MGAGAGTYLDILDQPDPLRRFLAGSLALHVSVAAAIISVYWIHPGGTNNGGISMAAGWVRWRLAS